MQTETLDQRGHAPGCRHYTKGEPPLADEGSTHVDLFCDCHKFHRPTVLKNGTDVAWPAGWGEAQAKEWRQANGLARPENPDKS